MLMDKNLTLCKRTYNYLGGLMLTWVKWNLHKDGTAVWDGFDTLHEAKIFIMAMQEKGYNPTIDHAMSKG